VYGNQRRWEMKKVAAVLAGCGVDDGAEFNETVLTLA
jgi:enhancing lycopene biosynthesis protein 2